MTLLERLYKLKSIPQREDYHPEGDTYTHVALVVGNILMNDEDPDMVMAGVFHDLGKLETASVNPKTGFPTAYGHEFVSATLVDEYSDFIDNFGADVEAVKWVVKNHMKMKQLNKMRQFKQDQLLKNEHFPKLEKFSEYDDMLKLFNETFEYERAEMLMKFDIFVNQNLKEL